MRAENSHLGSGNVDRKGAFVVVVGARSLPLLLRTAPAQRKHQLVIDLYGYRWDSKVPRSLDLAVDKAKDFFDTTNACQKLIQLWSQVNLWIADHILLLLLRTGVHARVQTGKQNYFQSSKTRFKSSKANLVKS